MITKVDLTNFQAHTSLSLQMGSLTCLTGPSNSGKSAVLRAIAALLRNDSAGDYITHGKKELRVKLHMSDGGSVEWVKGGTANDYTLILPDGKKTEFKKVGANIPEEVADYLKIGPIVLEDGAKAHINLHEQQESPFLVTDTAGHVAKVFGELTSAGKLFTAANEGNRRVREANKRKTLRAEDLQTVEQRIADFAYLQDVKAKMEELEERCADAKALQDQLSILTAIREVHPDLLYKVKEIDERVSALQTIANYDITSLQGLQTTLQEKVKVASGIKLAAQTITDLFVREGELSPSADVDLTKIEEISSELLEAKTLHGQLGSLSGQLDRVSNEYSKLEEAAQVDLSNLDKYVYAVKAMKSVGAALEDANLKHENIFLALGVAASHLDRASQEFNQIDTCPTCEQELTQEAKEHLKGTSCA